MNTLKLISSSKKGSNVKKALEEATKEVNKNLINEKGSIAKINLKTNVGLPGASVDLLVTIDDKKQVNKKIAWVNAGGSTEEKALQRAKEEINPKINEIDGELADSHIEYISPPMPKKIYVTILLGINEKVPEKTENLTKSERRARIRQIINLTGGNAKIINISELAKTFNVSRDVIYNDLNKLDIER